MLLAAGRGGCFGDVKVDDPLFHEDAQDVLLVGVEQEFVVVVLGGVREEDERTHHLRLEPLAHRETGQRLPEVHHQLHEDHV